MVKTPGIAVGGHVHVLLIGTDVPKLRKGEYVQGEVVDIGRPSCGDLFFVLNLPAGDYRALVVADLNGDGFYGGEEVLGGRTLRVGAEFAPEWVLSGVDIELGAGVGLALSPFRLAVASSLWREGKASYSLVDEIFSRKMARTGLYEPAVFMESAPMMLYALDRESKSKSLVIFVHGIDGSPKDFDALVHALDRDRFQPVVYYYPSGSSLGKVSALFCSMVLAGGLPSLVGRRATIVAHSMGGVVVREAFSRCAGQRLKLEVNHLVTIASPLGGHPSARRAAVAPVVIPSWRDMNPESDFIRRLHRHPLPGSLAYHLFFTFGDPAILRMGENGDGVVPLWSQLAGPAQSEAFEVLGFNDAHVGVLSDPAAIARVMSIIGQAAPRRKRSAQHQR